ncbi:MAG: phosphocholine cytidylyltransferase family protein [Planctomycetota bacterium]|jgi:choline kinase
MPVKAILLAAGRGDRLGDSELPKPLWEIGPRSLSDPTPVTILERQIERLQALEVDPIGVVVSWKKEMIRERLKDAGVFFIENTHPDLSQSGSAHSFRFAARSELGPLDGSEACLVLDADLVYESRVLEIIVWGKGGTRMLVAPQTSDDSEEVRVYGVKGRPRLLGKGLDSPRTDGMELLGEATGVVRFEPGDHGRVRALLDDIKISDEHESIAQALMDEDRMEVVAFKKGLLFSEADFRADFERIRTEIYPEILLREAE